MRILTLFIFGIVFNSLLFACAAPAPTPTLPPTAAPLMPTIAPPPITPTSAATTPVRVKISSGEVEGVNQNNLNVFKGIPFAAPPIGDLRWREPQSVAAWDGVRQAKTFGNACPQPATKVPGAGVSSSQNEDCLYLNIWTPTTDPNAKLPVMVWIHGGALVVGDGASPIYDGSALAERGAVVVTINYRLGHLGFFSHPALDKQSPNGTVNFGLLDEIAALKWVQENIAQFGGDPNNVMIFGESAGAQSVLALFASPLAQGLFHKGIAESSYGVPSNTRKKALDAGIQVANAVGLNGADATLEELRAVPAEKFAPLNQKGMTLAPVFVVGDAALPEPILEIFEKGKQAPVPLIIGNNSDEATVAEAFGINPADLIKQLGLLRIAVKRLYPGVNDNAQLGSELIRDLVFTSFAERISDLHSVRAPSWRYYFSYIPVNLRGKEPGVPHGGEIPFVLDTGEYAPTTQGIITAADEEMAKRVSSYWFEFARSSKPNPNGEPEWAQNDLENNNVMEFGETIALQKDFMRARLNVFIGLLKFLGRLLNRE